MSKELPLQQFLSTPELQAKTSDEHIWFYSSTRIEKLVNISITLTLLIFGYVLSRLS
jgi:hypothetical protein